MQIKKHLSFGALCKMLSERFLSIKDHRQSGKIKHTLKNGFLFNNSLNFGCHQSDTVFLALHRELLAIGNKRLTIFLQRLQGLLHFPP